MTGNRTSDPFNDGNAEPRREIRWESVPCGRIGNTRLREDIDRSGESVVCLRWQIVRPDGFVETEAHDAVYFPRIGIVGAEAGGNPDWSDVSGSGDGAVEEALLRYVNGGDGWE